MTLAVIIVIAVGLPLLFYCSLMFDRLVKAEYEIKRMVWEADGKPAASLLEGSGSAPLCFLCGKELQLLQILHDLRARPIFRTNKLAAQHARRINNKSLRLAGGAIKFSTFFLLIVHR